MAACASRAWGRTTVHCWSTPSMSPILPPEASAETRRGGDKWDYSLNDPFPDFRIRSGHLEGVVDASPRFNLSGPLVKDKLYFVEGFQYLFNNQEVRTLPYPENLTRST